jgi:flagellar L-ring protein precursor FlgH
MLIMWNASLYLYLTRISIVFQIVFLLLSLTGCVATGVVKNEYEPPKVVAQEQVKLRNGAIYQDEMPVSWVVDTTARHVGDIITINLVENASAKSSSNTKAAKKQNLDMPSPKIAGADVKHNDQKVLETKVNAGRDFSAGGNTDESHAFTATLTVSVVRVMPNNYLVVRGEKIILLNQAEEYIQFSGIVRPQDIDINNTVPSGKVGDAKIKYGGRGVLSSANTMGPLAKFFQSPEYPY